MQHHNGALVQVHNPAKARWRNRAFRHWRIWAFAGLPNGAMAQIHIWPTRAHLMIITIGAHIDTETFCFPEKWSAQIAKDGA